MTRRLMGIFFAPLLVAQCAATLTPTEPVQGRAQLPATPTGVEVQPAAPFGVPVILPAGVYRWDDPRIAKPGIIEAPGPTYTMEALLKKVNGYVLLHGIIGTNGEMTDVRLLQPLEASLDDAARQVMSRWRFRPATLDGEAVPVAITVKMAFTTR
jgi:TonB family protein